MFAFSSDRSASYFTVRLKLVYQSRATGFALETHVLVLPNYNNVADTKDWFTNILKFSLKLDFQKIFGRKKSRSDSQ